jgi:hypothetical protein
MPLHELMTDSRPQFNYRIVTCYFPITGTLFLIIFNLLIDAYINCMDKHVASDSLKKVTRPGEKITLINHVVFLEERGDVQSKQPIIWM